jgi:ribosome biogenesis protein ENP2
MKQSRYLHSEVVDIQYLLSADYGKLAALLDNHTVAFHAYYGKHEAVRIPKFGRPVGYEPTTCELLLVASGPQVYQLNLDEGRFRNRGRWKSWKPCLRALLFASTNCCGGGGFLC